MKNCLSFFMKCLFVHVWVMLAVVSGPVSGQEKDSAHLAKPAAVSDSVPHARRGVPKVGTVPQLPGKAVSPGDTLLTGKPPLDSIPPLPDSLRRRVVVGRTDPLDTLPNRLFAYRVLSSNSYARLQVPIDTTMSRFDINNPVMRNYYAGSYLGNTGLSYYPIGFEARRRPSDFPFLDHVADYLHDPESTVYYQTRSPYTHVDYSSAGPKAQNESIFKLVHTQNVNKNWNVGMHYDIFTSAGQYTNQNASDNGFTLFSAYRGSQYSMYTNFNWNNVRMRENGGLANPNGEDGFMTSYENAANYPVRSNAGKTVLLNRSFYLMHSYSPEKLGRKGKTGDSTDVSRFTLVHTLKYEWNKRDFTDMATYALNGRDPNFEKDAQGNVATHDSLHFRRVFNHLELMIKEQSRRRFTAGFSAGLLAEFDRYNINMIPRITVKDTTMSEPHRPQNTGWGGDLPNISGKDFINYYRETEKYINTAITGRFFNHTGRYLNWDINGRLYFTGYKLGDININGTVQMHYYTSKGHNTLLLGGSIDNAHPSYFLHSYASNWLAWDNNFDLSQEIRLRGEFIMPYRKLKLGVYVSLLKDYVYIDKDAAPAQLPNPITTETAYIEKDIRWWKLGFQFRFYGQYSSNNSIIPLPAFAGFQSTYFETQVVKNVLTAQLGWNISYHTKYYAYAYMPSTGMFYLQEEQEIGNYPFFDFFLNLQIKRARIFVRTDGLNTVFSKVLGKGNFMVYRYPTNDFRVKFGVSWAFYD